MTMKSERRCDPSATDTVSHTVHMPQMCPVSGNPLPGSWLTVSYSPSAGKVVDVDLLAAWLQSHVGGGPDGVREMERVIQRCADWCHEQSGAPVKVTAHLLIRTNPASTQTMTVTAQRGQCS